MKSPEHKGGLKDYHFVFVHPNNGCAASGKAIPRYFMAPNWREARILAENALVVCDGCGVKFELKEPLNKSL